MTLVLAARRQARGGLTLAGLSALLLWLLVGVQAAYWGWRVWGNPVPEPQPLPVRSAEAVDPARMARALGAGAPAAPSEAESALPTAGGWRLAGVIADRDGGGAAVLVRDGAPARVYRVGSTLPDGWRISRIERAAAWLAPAQGGEPLRLSVPTSSR